MSTLVDPSAETAAAKSYQPEIELCQAAQADKFDCYQKSVQCPEHEVDFINQAYKDAYGKKPYSLREDFCGTFAVCCEWVKSNRRRTAVGVDLCGETLAWGRNNNLARLTDKQQQRVTVLEQDVRQQDSDKFDVVAAQNFSFWIFKTREQVVEYFRAVYNHLDERGIFVTDMMGGSECYEEGHVEKKKIGKGKKRFKYQWEQASFNPITNEITCHIHFKFPDGSRLKRAFTYEWRFWTIPEVREMMAEAGFSSSSVYLSDEDDDGEEFWRRAEVAPSDATWLAYIVGIK